VPSAIRLLAVIEASTITGPAKNLLQFARLARSPLQGRPITVEIVVFQRKDAPTLFLDTARELGIPVHVMPEAGRFDSSVIGNLKSLIGTVRPDIVQSHAVKSHFIVRQTGLSAKVPWVAFHHGYTAPDLRARLYNQLDWWSLRSARHAITVSQPFRRDLIRRGVAPEHVSVVHNSVDPNWASSYRQPQSASALRKQLGIAPTAKVILLVGRFSSEKDHQTLLNAVADMRARRELPAVHLCLVGDGPERARVQEAIRSLGLEQASTLTGQVPSAEPYYGIADIAVLSSRTEGSPNALLEAMAAGVPVVATTVGGIPEIVTDGESALLVPPGDRASMARALATLVADDLLAQKLAQRSRERVLAHYTPEVRAANLISIYSAVAGENPSSPALRKNPPVSGDK
jgi:glycosyltransferase involved in cell wall biosynthesis